MTDAKTRQANRERQRKYREAHRDEINKQRKERYSDRIANGKCPRCGGKAKSGYTLCVNCCEYQANLNRKYAKVRKSTAGKTASAKKTVKTSTKKPVAKPAAKKPSAKKTAAKAKPAAKKKPVKQIKAKPKAKAKK